MSADLQDSSSDLYKIRHSMAHILAQAVKHEFPQAKLGFGPPTESGFYYDFDFGDLEFKEEHLKRISKRMKKILAAPQQPFERTNYDFKGAIELCESLSEPYKKAYVHALHRRGVREFSFFSHGSFQDLCEGPHVPSTRDLSAGSFHLHRVSGAYWLGDEKQPMLTRIYAHCFSTAEQLKAYRERLELAQKYDHHRLGVQLELFTFDDRVGKGLPLWLPAGTAVRQAIERYAEEVEFDHGYHRVHTPVLAKKELYESSGHLSMYQQSMFPPIVCSHEHSQHQEHYYLRPMNCPHHHLIYSHKTRSYRDLPLRLAEYGESFRYEQSGELSGLIRVRSMAINDGHIYLRRDQVAAELRDILQMYRDFYATFALTDYTFRLSVRGGETTDDKQKFQGSSELWHQAEKILREVLEQENLPYELGQGEAAFYGPKIDVQFRNLMGREETVSTIQIDFLAADNFKLRYIDAAGQEQKTVVIHRSPLSTHERFMSYLIEYYGGAFPTWCAPVQVAVVPVHENSHPYAQQLISGLRRQKVRVEGCLGSESFSKKIRHNMVRKIPISVIIGKDEVAEDKVTLRRFGRKESHTMGKKEFLQSLDREIQNREFPHRDIIPAHRLNM